MGTSKAFATMFFLAISLGNVNGDGVYKWVDEKGNVTYSSTPPPADSRIQGESLDHIDPASKPLTEEEFREIERQRQSMLRTLEIYREMNADRRTARTNQQNVQQNSAEVLRLRREAQALFKRAASPERMLVAQREALQEQARALQRMADVLAGQRTTIAPTVVEDYQRRIRQLENQLDSPSSPPTTSPPQYVPSIEKWCQKQGGVMNCW